MAKAALQDPTHDVAGDHHIRIGEAVANPASLAPGLHEAGGPEDREGLGAIGLRDPETLGEPSDLGRLIREPMEDLEPARAGQRLEDLGL